MPLPFIDASINMITLYGFILVLGIVVDDAIVIGESIYDTVERDGPGRSSVVAGAKEVATPATFGVLTTVAAFVPLITIPGVNGKMWAGIGYVVILCLVFSLIESKLILPAHLRHIKDRPGTSSRLDRGRAKIRRYLDEFLEKRYRPALTVCIEYRYATLAAFVGIFVLAMVCVKTGVVRFVFYPDIDSDILLVDLEMSKDVSWDRLRTVAQRIEEAATQVNDVFMVDGEREPPLKRPPDLQ